MKFFNKKMTVVALKGNIKALAKQIGVNKVTYSSNGLYIDGSYRFETKVIYICSKLTKKVILQTFFHELAHHVACKRGWWKKYHLTEVTDSGKAFDIENQIDRLACKLWNKHVDNTIWGKYRFSYLVKDRRKRISDLNLIYGLN